MPGLLDAADDHKLVERLTNDIQAKEDCYNYDSEYSEVDDPQGICEQFMLVAHLSIGPIISMFFYMFAQLISTYYVGH
jgi:hypothetical protein